MSKHEKPAINLKFTEYQQKGKVELNNINIYFI